MHKKNLARRSHKRQIGPRRHREPARNVSPHKKDGLRSKRRPPGPLIVNFQLPVFNCFRAASPNIFASLRAPSRTRGDMPMPCEVSAGCMPTT